MIKLAEVSPIKPRGSVDRWAILTAGHNDIHVPFAVFPQSNTKKQKQDSIPKEYTKQQFRLLDAYLKLIPIIFPENTDRKKKTKEKKTSCRACGTGGGRGERSGGWRWGGGGAFTGLLLEYTHHSHR